MNNQTSKRLGQLGVGLFLASVFIAIIVVLAMAIGDHPAPTVSSNGTETTLPSPKVDSQVAPLTDRTPLGTATLRVVRMETGEPVPGLEVVASRQSAHDRRQYWMQEAMQFGRQCEALGATDSEGALPLPGGGAYRFATRNSRLFFVPDDRAVVQADTVVTLSVAVGADVSGTVWTTQGSPAEGAVVSAEILGDANAGRVCHVDEKGAFALRALPPLQAIDLWFVDDGYAPQRVHLEPLLPETSVQIAPIVLDPGFSLRVRLRDAATGASIAGAALELHPEDDCMPLPPEDETTTPQGDGRFVGLAGGTYRLIARAPRYVVAQELVEVRSDLEREIGMEQGVEVSGRVVESGTGAPIPKCLAKATFGGRRAQTFTDDDGRFQLWTSEGPFRVGFEHAGHVKKNVRGTAPALMGDVELESEGILRGRVVDQDGAPCTEFRVRMAEAKGGSREGVHAGRATLVNSSSDGTFAIDRLRGGTYVVEAWTPTGLAMGEAEIHSGSTTTIELRLVAHENVMGLVIDASDSSPVIGARVTIPLEPLGGLSALEPRGGIGEILREALGTPTASGPVETDARGEFQIGVPVRGGHSLRVSHEKYHGQMVALPEETPRSGIVIRLEPKEWFTGKCIDGQGNGIAGIEVSLTDGESLFPMSTTRTGRDGSFSCAKEREASVYRLVVSNRTGLWYESRRLDPAALDGHAFVVPRASSGLRGRLDRAVSNLLVARIPPQETGPDTDMRIKPLWPRVTVKGDSEGLWALDGLAAGRLLLYWVSDGTAQRKVISLGIDEIVTVNL